MSKDIQALLAEQKRINERITSGATTKAKPNAKPRRRKQS